MRPAQFAWGELERRSSVTAFIRLFGFRPTSAGALPDQHLREVLLPGLFNQAGLRYAYAGRAGAGTDAERMVASIWETSGNGPTPQELGRPFDFELDDDVGQPAIEVFDAVVSLPFAEPEEAHILRVLRGQTRPKELEAYVEDARGGTYADVAARHGPAALFLGVQPPDRFVTVSVWTGWDNIQAATGGDYRNPIATRHSHRLVSATAAHYELLPSTVAGGGPPPPPHARPRRVADRPGRSDGGWRRGRVGISQHRSG